jgi:hypothetical protein
MIYLLEPVSRFSRDRRNKWRSPRCEGERSNSGAYLWNEPHDLPPSLVEDTIAHNQHPSAEASRQQLLGHKGNHCYLASICRRERLTALVHDPRWPSSAEDVPE